MTGELRWAVAAKPDMPRELGVPASLTYQVVDRVPQVIVATYGTREVLGVHAATGEVMWHYPYPADIIIGLISTPVAIGSRLFLSAGEGKGRSFSACLRMKAVDGKITCREVYTSTELQTNLFHTVAVYQDAVFGFGGGSKAGFLHCTNFEDGRLLWKEESKDWTKDQNMVIADGLIFALTKNEELVMGEASRERYRESGACVWASSWADRSNRPSPTAGCISAGTDGSSATSLPRHHRKKRRINSKQITEFTVTCCFRRTPRCNGDEAVGITLPSPFISSISLPSLGIGCHDLGSSGISFYRRPLFP